MHSLRPTWSLLKILLSDNSLSIAHKSLRVNPETPGSSRDGIKSLNAGTKTSEPQYALSWKLSRGNVEYASSHEREMGIACSHAYMIRAAYAGGGKCEKNFGLVFERLW